MSRHETETGHEPLAIVGIGCRFPGGATGPESFWELLRDGVDATRELPEDRWEAGKFYDPDVTKLGKMSTVRGGFLDRVDQFDAQFFGISPREAIWLDPQQRLLLLAAWEALEDGGQVAEDLAGGDTGVFVGGFTLDYQLLQNYGVHSRYELQANSATGMMMTMLANRLSYCFDFRGPSIAVDTACSGSLVAVHLAAQAVWNGECRTALAGGVNVMLAPNMTIAESKGGFLSPDGRCKTFDASADGYARGEGAGVVLLKPLGDALADRDLIYALIRGTAVSQDGRTNGITVPSGDAQEAAMRAACARAGIAPSEIRYVEAHGTGTPVGDPVEAGAIGRVMGAGRPPDRPLVIGSVKANIGHLEAAAGVAGLIKAALCLKHGRIPGQLHFTDPNPAIPFAELGLRVQTELTDWPQAPGPRYAGVNSFGFGGTNAHVVLEEAPAAPPAPSPAERPDDQTRCYLIPLSARTPEALTQMAGELAEALADGAHDLGDVGYSRSLRRSHHDHRLAVVAATPAEAAERLEAFAKGRATEGVATGRAAPGGRPKLAFVCSGMGPQWWAMGRQLLETELVFRAEVLRCDAELRRYTGRSLLEEMLTAEDESRMAETEVAQPANFALQLGLAALWRSWGIVPDAIVGHSTGEMAAQYLSGVLGFEDAVRVTYYRSSLQQRATGRGRMLAVGLTPETLNQVVADAGPTVSVAAVNSPSSVTLSGDAATLEGMAAQLETFGVFHRFLTVKVPYHSHAMDFLREDLLSGLADLRPRSARIPLYSTVTGCRIDGGGADARYWWQNVRATVLFAPAFRQMVADGYTHFLELGPHPVLSAAMTELLSEQEQEGLVVPSLHRQEPENAVLLKSLGALYGHGHGVKWAELYGGDAGLVRLPTYPWQHKSYWNESVEAREDRHYRQVHPLLGQRMNAARPTWEREVSTRLLPYLDDHRVQGSTLLPGAAFIEMASAAARDVFGDGDYTIEDLDLRKALILSAPADVRLRTTLHEELGTVEFAGFAAGPGGRREWTVHATARLSRRGPDRRRQDLDEARAACSEHVSHEAFYARSQRMGFQYGPAFQAVQEVVSGDGLAVGRVTLPPDVDMDGYRFHPCLIDAAFQVLLTAASPPDTDGEAQAPTYLPVGVERVHVVGPQVSDLLVVARVRQADGNRIVSDLTLCDDEGRILVDIQGFQARSLDAAASLSLDRLDRGIYEVEWQEAPRDAEADAEAEAAPEEADGTWVVFADRSGVAEELRRQLAGRRIVTVRHGDVAEVVEQGHDAFLIDPGSADHYREVLHGLPDLTTIVHLWSLDAPSAAEHTVAGLEEAQETGVLSVMRVMQEVPAEPGRLPRVWLATRRAQAVGERHGPVAVAQAPLWGLGRVIGHQEFAGMWGGIVDLDEEGADRQARRLIGEIAAPLGEDQVAFRDGRRHVPRVVASTRLTRPFPAAMRDDASYLVTGGLGALGLLVADFLVERGARHLVLLGRSPLPPRGSWHHLADDHPQRAAVTALLDLESRGAAVYYAAVDAADEERLTAWLGEHERLGRPPVRGVVHTAGVVADELLARMSRETFAKVLRPKLTGGWLLHELFRETELDFFLLFGSTGSVITSPGQGNYAAANAFLDALAHHRRSLGLPAHSIGWGPWSVGMVEKLNLQELYARRGIGLITPEAGKRILGRVLDQRPAHLIVIDADWETARRTSPGGRLPSMFARLGAQDADDREGADGGEGAVLAALAAAPEERRADVLAAHLHDDAALVLSLDPAEFGDDDTLSGLGLDSMMAIEMKQRIDAELRVDLPVLEILQGVTVAELAARVLSLLDLGASAAPEASGGADAGEPGSGERGPGEGDAGEPGSADELDALLEQFTLDDLESVLRELEHDTDDPSGATDHEPVTESPA